METVAFILGTTGVSFAIIGWGLVNSLRREFEDLKTQLQESGSLSDRTDPSDE